MRRRLVPQTWWQAWPCCWPTMSHSAVSTPAIAWIAAPRRPYHRLAVYSSAQRAGGSSGSLPPRHAPSPWRNGADIGASMIARLTVAFDTASPCHLLGPVRLALDLGQAQMQRFDAGDLHE